jgi:CheY-like chemotaxis protein
MDGPKVLCVDDEPEAAWAAAFVLQKVGCEVRVCTDPAEALAAAEEFRPDVCLLDLMMPGMDGDELARRLRGRSVGRPLRLVALTGLEDERARRRVRDAGFSAHLVKPVDPQTLVGAVTGRAPPG